MDRSERDVPLRGATGGEHQTVPPRRPPTALPSMARLRGRGAFVLREPGVGDAGEFVGIDGIL